MAAKKEKSTSAIKVSSKTIETDINNLNPFQGELKSLTDESYKNLEKSINENDFCVPFLGFKAKDQKIYILDGHQRLRFLRKKREEGVVVPQVPVNLHTNIKTEKQAKKFILQMNSRIGQISKESLYEFMFENDLDPLEIFEDMSIYDINENDFMSEFFDESFGGGESTGGEENYLIQVRFGSDSEMRHIHDDLMSKGYMVKIL